MTQKQIKKMQSQVRACRKLYNNAIHGASTIHERSVWLNKYTRARGDVSDELAKLDQTSPVAGRLERSFRSSNYQKMLGCLRAIQRVQRHSACCHVAKRVRWCSKHHPMRTGACIIAGVACLAGCVVGIAVCGRGSTNGK